MKRLAERRKVFIISGVHRAETTFGKPVAQDVARRLREAGSTPSTLHIPTEIEKRRLMNLHGSWRQGKDWHALKAHYHLVEHRGFEPENAEHILLDFHENPLNWQQPGIYAEYAGDYSKRVQPHIAKSQRQGTLGIYAARIIGPESYNDIWEMQRVPLKGIRTTDRLLRLEIPVIGRRKKGIGVVADEQETLEHFGAATKRELVERLGKLIFAQLFTR